MKLLVGLGNPGAQYVRTRHNMGYEVVDDLAARHAPGAVPRSRFHSLTIEATLRSAAGAEERCLLMKPTTYMNRSGQAVADAVRFYKIEPATDLLVIVDDMNLSLSMIRIRAEGGAGGHNGLASIQQMLGSAQYARLRIGIDEPGRIPQTDYVLGRFSDAQWHEISPVIERASSAAELWVHQGAAAAMNAINTRQEDARSAQLAEDERQKSENDSDQPQRQSPAPNPGETSRP